MQIFREGLLEGRSIALSSAVAGEVRELLRSLGARLCELDPELEGDEERTLAWARGAAPLDALVCGEARAEDRFLSETWAAVRAVAVEVFIPKRAGRIVLIAPNADESAAAALENLARTLSVEWARFGTTAVAIVPGNSTADEEIATLVAFLCSPAGGYYSGCRFDLS